MSAPSSASMTGPPTRSKSRRGRPILKSSFHGCTLIVPLSMCTVKSAGNASRMLASTLSPEMNGATSGSKRGKMIKKRTVPKSTSELQKCVTPAAACGVCKMSNLQYASGLTCKVRPAGCVNIRKSMRAKNKAAQANAIKVPNPRVDNSSCKYAPTKADNAATATAAAPRMPRPMPRASASACERADGKRSACPGPYLSEES
mmetsp:Transcript_76905/g.199975  ORF Transcript_76905/g.199975 Transcript_76905/m.199975 type:complete len:202 (-) Transcript_76905:20-625(-)